MSNEGRSVRYPALNGKVVKEVRFTDDEAFTALTIEFEDSTHVTFQMKAAVALVMKPEISTLMNGDIVGWKQLKTGPAKSRVEAR